MKKLLLALAASAALLVAAPVAEAQNAPGVFTTANTLISLSSANSATTNLSTANLVFVPTHVAPGQVAAAPPMDCGIWVSFAATASATNQVTYTFAPSFDKTNLITSGTFTVAVVANGTNVVNVYNFINRTNYMGAPWLALVGMQVASNNVATTITTASAAVYWPQ
jgi:hypothetical protein